MQDFWDALRESVVLSGFICVTCVGTLCYLAICGRPIPDVLVNISLTVVAFFFGTKVGQSKTFRSSH